MALRPCQCTVQVFQTALADDILMNLVETKREIARCSHTAPSSGRERQLPRLDGSARCDVAIVGGDLGGPSARDRNGSVC